ncbi:glycosyltransferase [Hymenobacter sp. RP-2-7]|uniref:Glycosyltransferase n=1 Tax=Hymenobacter polaris TaxID=2682546 RepID=A0A7Y0FLR1_9BACT|nr:glycosyltransferase [Hymenobacter polaris]NML64664.1 glycosyltransferase [Hymenobacter polaris]
MKIVFLCGSLEIGRDGVGDYVRRLAIELSQYEHQVTGIALNDHYVTEETSSLSQIEDNNISIIRLPSIWSSKQRFNRVQYWIDMSNPEWISLQFVPFSFHHKGLHFGLTEQLIKVGKNRLWHIMVHELWVGMEKETSIKYRYWGEVQKYLIKNLIAKINPKVIHTQLLLYKIELAKMGFVSNLLLLFSNIPAANKVLNKNSVLVKNTSAYKNEISLIVFGHIHPDAPINQFAYDASQYAKRNNIVISLTMIGRCGSEQEHWAAQWKSFNLPVRILGEQNAECISLTLQNSSLGIATNPIHLVGKSGTAAAMKEHGLPIICVSRPWNPRDTKELELPANIYAYSEGEFDKYIDNYLYISAPSDISAVSQQLLHDLLNAN